MNEKNKALVQKAFGVLLPELVRFIATALLSSYGDAWQKTAFEALKEQGKDLPENDDLTQTLDLSSCLLLIQAQWKDVFRKKFSRNTSKIRAWLIELFSCCDEGSEFTDESADRAIDTAACVCEHVAPLAATEIRKILRETRYRQIAPSSQSTPISNAPLLEAESRDRLPSWREVVSPRSDVANGTYNVADFAADLNLVALGEASVEYQDPIEFFSRTYLTRGMVELLAQAVKRVSGLGGDPVIQLKTSFGGGKTHSMLALYHLLRGAANADDLPNIEEVLRVSGVSVVPKTNVAVVVGTALDPLGNKRSTHIPGVCINTIWGEIVGQLAKNAGKEELFDLIKESDKRGTSPDSNKLRAIFDACGPCLILIDELLVYGRQLYNPSDVRMKTRFESFISFFQVLTEAVKGSKNSVLVASLPESESELGGEGGKIVLNMLEKHFGRVEAVWKPVDEEEGFEIVRRRLFNSYRNESEVVRVCDAYATTYEAKSEFFPVGAKEADYKRRLKRCYPFHPEFFDVIYKEWTTLEDFQRTRGVLRLSAKIVQELWTNGDKSLLITPGAIPLNLPGVRQEFLKYLPSEGAWQTILESEIDGENAESVKQDRDNGNFGPYNASRRVARAVFLRSAPHTREQGANRGVKLSQVLLSVAEPQEQEKIWVFKEALSALRMRSSYLYVNENDSNYYYDARPSLRKKMQERAQNVDARKVEEEIAARLKRFVGNASFVGVHVCPTSSADVPDDDSVRLVVLGIAKTYNQTLGDDGAAVKEAAKILNYRGESPRIRKNVLVFVVPRDNYAGALRESVKNYLAWESILRDSYELNLDESQKKEAENGKLQEARTIEARIYETYNVLLTPRIDVEVDLSRVVWENNSLGGGREKLDAKALRVMSDAETLITNWAPMFLKVELDKYLWKETEQSDVSISKVWDYLTTYCYAPRLKGFGVLQATIRQGVEANLFAVASSRREGDDYVDLQTNCRNVNFNKDSLLVKIDVAEKQVEREAARKAAKSGTVGSVGKSNEGDGAPGGSSADTKPTPPAPPAKTLSTYYCGEAKLSPLRPIKDLDQILQEIVKAFPDGTKTTFLLTIDAQFPEGISEEKKSVVEANSSTLKIHYEFGGES